MNASMPRGDVILALDAIALRLRLQMAYDAGIRACAIVLMHAYRAPVHEIEAAAAARAIGFTRFPPRMR